MHQEKHLVCYGRNYNEANEAQMPHTEIDNLFFDFWFFLYIYKYLYKKLWLLN